LVQTQADDLKMDRRVTLATANLVAASLVIAIAILAGDPIAKIVNGIGGVLWIGSAIMLIVALRQQKRFIHFVSFILADCLLLVLLVKPSDYLWAIIGFGLGGVLVGFITGTQARNWAPLLPAVWLPAHLIVAVGRAIVRSIEGTEASVRTDPPPTAALVPFAMVVASIAGAFLIDWLRNRSIARTSGQSLQSR
jgi:hypothetical protein